VNHFKEVIALVITETTTGTVSVLSGKNTFVVWLISLLRTAVLVSKILAEIPGHFIPSKTGSNQKRTQELLSELFDFCSHVRQRGGAKPGMTLLPLYRDLRLR